MKIARRIAFCALIAIATAGGGATILASVVAPAAAVPASQAAPPAMSIFWVGVAARDCKPVSRALAYALRDKVLTEVEVEAVARVGIRASARYAGAVMTNYARAEAGVPREPLPVVCRLDDDRLRAI